MAHLAFVAAVPLSQRTQLSTQFSTTRRPAHRPRRCRATAPRAQQGSDGSDPPHFLSEEEDYLGAASRRRSGSEARELLDRLALTPAEVGNERETEAARKFASSYSALTFVLTELPKTLNRRAERYLESWPQLLVSSSVAILFGFYTATAFHTIIVSVVEWDTLSAFVLLFWTELFTRFYYRTDPNKRTRLLQLANAFKIGIIYGMCVDAMKLST